MSATEHDDTTSDDTTSEPTEPDEPTQDAPEPAEDERGGKEAAKYRTRLRAAETERDNLAERVRAVQRAEVERLAGHLTRPDAIWAAGVQLTDVLDDQGDVDPEKVRLVVTAAAEQLGLARAPRNPRPDPSQGGANSSGPTGPAFSDAFSPRRR